MISFIVNNVTFVQVLWTSVAIVGLIFAWTNFRASDIVVKRLEILRDAKDEIELRVSRSLRMTELFRVIVQLINLSIGLLSFVTVPVTHIHTLPLKYQLLGYAFRWGLVLSATLTTMQSVNLYFLRRYFLRKNEDGHHDLH